MTSDLLSIRLVQSNPVVGDLVGNLDHALSELSDAIAAGVDLLVFPELAICGYPPEDLILKPSFLEHCELAIQKLAAATMSEGPAVVIGTPWRGHSGDVFNSAVWLADGQIVARYDKRELPNYGVFDEKRLFSSGSSPYVIQQLKGVRVALAICEDLWFERVPRALASQGAELLIAPNASPWRRTITEERMAAFGRWSDLQMPYVFTNLVGGQDELVFDGSSFVVDADGHRSQVAPAFKAATTNVRYDPAAGRFSIDAEFVTPAGEEADYTASMLGLRDYVDKNRFKGVVLGLSGGIDSALTAAIACDALGPERVWCVMMPSRYTSASSLEDATACAERLAVRYDTIPIGEGVAAFDSMLEDVFAGRAPGVTEENIQSRLRGMILMALSNKFGPMVVTTGNKSEMAVGYATLYGDMNGGFNPLKDLYKTEVFAASHWRNANVPEGSLCPALDVIPERIITKPPSAELRADQKDEDSLPPYDVLDDILRALVDRDEDVDDVISKGHAPDIVRRIEHLVYLAEYKRRQAPPGVKVGRRNFGRDRRYPITNRWRDD